MEPFDFLESEKFTNRARIFNCDELEEMMTKEDKLEELSEFENRRIEDRQDKKLK